MKRRIFSSIGGVMRVLSIGLILIAMALTGRAQTVTVNATAATLGPTAYMTLQAAFAAINVGTHQGAITITIGGTGPTETATALLNPNAPPANYTSVNIKPAPGSTPSIRGNFNAALIHLLGASNVTFDGSNTVGGTTRDLTITNTFAGFGGTTACIRLGSAPTVGVNNISIRNCKLANGASGVGMCITSGSGTVIFQQGTQQANNVTIRNNEFNTAQLGVYAWGPNAPALDNNWVVDSNQISGTGFGGIQINNGSNYSITRNRISGVTIFGNGRMTGITLSFSAVNATIANNIISNVTATIAGFGADGIFVSAFPVTPNSINIYNNFVSGVSGIGSPTLGFNAHGIYLEGGTGFRVNHNSVNMNATSTGVPTDAAITIGAGMPAGNVISLVDNIFVNNQTGANTYAIYSASGSAAFAAIDYNDYVSAATNLGFIGTPRLDLAAIQAGFGGNLNSINFIPAFVSPTDLHLQLIASNSALAIGTPITTPLINTDIDGAQRSAVTPTLGAHELNSRITYTALPNTCSNLNDTLNGVLIESPSGIPTTGLFAPRIYFRKGAGAWQSTQGTLMSGSGTTGIWRFVIDVALLGGVTAGDNISYYVVAQTSGGNVFANPSTGLVASDVNTVTTPPTTLNSFVVNAVTMSGLTPSHNMCFNPATSVVLPYAYTATTGAPNQYTLTWLPLGPSAVPVMSPLPASPINVTVPAAMTPANYNGFLTIRNSTTGCSRVYNITLTINPLPATISGSSIVCQGSTTTLTSSSGGGVWTTSAPGIATVTSASGIVTGVTSGTANITYTLPTGCTTFFTITVVAPPTPITGPSNLCPGISDTLRTLTAGGTWSSTNTGVATIDPSLGVVTSVMPGTTTIQYVTPGCTPMSRVFTVNPTPDPIGGVLFACEGQSATVTTTSTGGTWISGSPTIASIGSTTGTFNGLAAGTSIITYRFTTTGCLSTNTVTIFPTPGPITGGPFVCSGLTTTLNNSLAGGTWSSSLPGVISIGATTGIATGVASVGTSTITYTMPTGCRRTATMIISVPPTAISGSASVCTGYTINLTNGTPGGTWSSNDPTIASVVPGTGVVTGVAAGITTISYNTVACNAAIYSVTVNQTPPPITGVLNLCNGGPTTTVFNSTPGGVWTMTGSGTISSTGVVSGLTVGAPNIVTYTVSNGCYAFAPITTDTIPAVIVGIDSICPGRTDTLRTAATGGVWSSSNSVIASIVAANGAVSGVTNGSVTITYTAVSGCFRTKSFLVTNPVVASVSLSHMPAVGTFCSGVAIEFKANPTNGGATPTYQWQLFGVDIPGATDSTYTYMPMHGDVLRVFMTNSDDICAAPVPAHTEMPINVYPNVAPVVSIVTASDSVADHLGQVVTFNSLVTGGGAGATYQWYVDGILEPGATNSTFTRAIYDNDTVTLRVNGNPPCPTGSVGTSNAIRIYWVNYLATTNVGSDLSLSLFPNPNNGSFRLSGKLGVATNEQVEVEIVNMLGQVVYSSSFAAKLGVVDSEIKLANDVPAGNYILRVNTEQGNQAFHFVIAN